MELHAQILKQNKCSCGLFYLFKQKKSMQRHHNRERGPNYVITKDPNNHLQRAKNFYIEKIKNSKTMVGDGANT